MSIGSTFEKWELRHCTFWEINTYLRVLLSYFDLEHDCQSIQQTNWQRSSPDIQQLRYFNKNYSPISKGRNCVRISRSPCANRIPTATSRDNPRYLLRAMGTSFQTARNKSTASKGLFTIKNEATAKPIRSCTCYMQKMKFMPKDTNDFKKIENTRDCTPENPTDFPSCITDWTCGNQEWVPTSFLVFALF